MMSFDYEQFYDWKLKCKCAEWTRSYNQSLPKEKRIDFQSPPEHFGGAIRIAIVPKKDHLPFVEVPIPEGATPVIHFFEGQNSQGESIGRYCRVGHNINGHRVMQMVDLETGKKSRLEDECGRIQMAGSDR